MPVTKDQAHVLAGLAIASRPHHARHWDAPGVIAAIAKVAHLALADVGMAVLRAAADRTLDTPGAIGNTTSSCWRERLTAPTQTPPRREESCLDCGRPLTTCATTTGCGQRRTRPIPTDPTRQSAAREAAYIAAHGRPRPEEDA